MKVASLSAFQNHPDRFFAWFHKLVKVSYHSKPNNAHYALAKLEQLGKSMGVITQNIDGLHSEAGSSNVLELHGSVRTAHCIQNNHEVAGEEYLPLFISSGKIPLCPYCQSVLKPDFVLYEELLPQDIWDSADILSEKCDLMIVVGSSLEVVPASSIPYRSVQNAAKLMIINMSDTHLDGFADLIIRDDASIVLPKIVECMK